MDNYIKYYLNKGKKIAFWFQYEATYENISKIKSLGICESKRLKELIDDLSYSKEHFNDQCDVGNLEAIYCQATDTGFEFFFRVGCCYTEHDYDTITIPEIRDLYNYIIKNEKN